jgi:ankyrin repeat protein
MKKHIVCIVVFLVLLTKIWAGGETETPNHRLITAAYAGNLSEVRSALGAGANINARDSSGYTPLMYASRGHLEVVKYLVERGANLYLKGNNGVSALGIASGAIGEYLSNVNNNNLYTAAQAGNLSGVRTALEFWANINYRSGQYSITPLMQASGNGYLEIVKYLVEKGASLNLFSNEGTTALMFAGNQGHLEVVKYLVEKGADITATDKNNRTALMQASGNGYLEIVKYMVEKGANLTLTDKNNRTALDWARANNKLAVVEYLSNIYNNDLIAAAQNGNLSNVRTALEKGANINYRSGQYNRTPLLEASYRGHLEVVKYLLERGANLNLVDRDGNTALDLARTGNKPAVYTHLSSLTGNNIFTAAQKGKLDDVRFLQQNGAYINQRSGDYNSTPLMEASLYGHLEVVKFLVEKGADITATDDDGDTAFFYARWGEHYPVIDYLRSQSTSLLYKAAKNGDTFSVELAVENGANINYRDNDDNTPIVIAAIAGKYDVVELLVELGANVNARNKEGRSALNYVYDRGDMDVYDFLVAHDARTFTPNPTPAPAPVIVVQAPAPATTPAPAPAPVVVAQQPAPAVAPAPQVSTPAPQTNVYVQPSIDTNVYVQPYTPATPAPSQTSSSSSVQNNLQRISDAVQKALNGSLDKGSYKESGGTAVISFTGMGNAGNLYYTDPDGKRSTGSYSISGDRITMNILGRTYFYTITSRTSFSGNGEQWFRAGY